MDTPWIISKGANDPHRFDHTDERWPWPGCSCPCGCERWASVALSPVEEREDDRIDPTMDLCKACFTGHVPVPVTGINPIPRPPEEDA